MENQITAESLKAITLENSTVEKILAQCKRYSRHGHGFAEWMGYISPDILGELCKLGFKCIYSKGDGFYKITWID